MGMSQRGGAVRHDRGISMGNNLSRDSVISQVKDIVLSHLAGTPARVYLFGSFARGEEKRSSDLDIAIDHAGDLTPHGFAELREILHESPFAFNVDIVDLREADEPFVSKVKRESVLWSG